MFEVPIRNLIDTDSITGFVDADSTMAIVVDSGETVTPTHKIMPENVRLTPYLGNPQAQ
jgi:hypothetical protein